MRPIDADALKNKSRIQRERVLDNLTVETAYVSADEIDNAPTLDVAPVVHARWIDPCINKYGHPCHHCSNCRFKASQKDKNYCPNCGARMDGEEK